jgi:PAS domain S-box-containing protein
MVQFGYGSKTGQGLDGFNSEIDNILHGKECDDVNDLNCLNVDDLMVMLDYHVNTIYDNYKNFTAEEKLAAMNQTFALTNTADDKTLKAVFLYSEIAYTNCKLPFPSAIIYVLTCIGLLALLIPFHMVIQAYIDSNHKLRTMFGMFTNEQIDAVPQIREYVYSYVLPSLVTTNKRAQDASTSVISIEAFMDGALLCNTQGVVTEINNAAKDIFGFNSSDIIGRHIRDAFTVSTGSDLESVLSDALKMSKGFTREYDALKKNGTKFPARVSVMTTKSGTQTLLVVFIADLTVQQKQKELLAIEKSKNEQLLLSILPASVALRLKRGDTNISESFDSVTCFFSDMVGFTSLSGKMSASELVEMLNNVVNRFDDLCKEHHLEKIKTIGDAYFCVGGLVPGDTDHAANCVRFAMAAIRAVTNEVGGGKINIRVGIHTGPIIAGVIGKSKFAFDCWGDTVNLASRMESTGLPGRIQVSRSTYERVHDLFEFEERYDIEVKGKGTMTTYVLKYEVEKVDIEEEYREEIEEEPSP